MNLIKTIKQIVLEYIHPDSVIIFQDKIEGIDVEVWRSPHPDELRGDKKRVPEERIFQKLLNESIRPIVQKYFLSGKQFRDITKEDPKKIRFAVRRIKGESRPQMIMQVEELNPEKIVLNIISFMDDGKDFFGINNPNKTRFILDLGEKDLVNK
jgi:hypothetical protein